MKVLLDMCMSGSLLEPLAKVVCGYECQGNGRDGESGDGVTVVKFAED